MSQNLRKEVLLAFKRLHKARKKVFANDDNALEKGRIKINEEFKKNKHVKDPVAIAELTKLANEVQKELLTTVIQAVEVSPGKYEMRILPETLKLDNVPFKDCPN
ncbi:complex III assembly factor LYRM7 [Onthophagus taurus]|uniref:complex III assembly factor LYRM7 n=1 Tax=Onthophagus taurus TaxID=166361 RepID=UPI000C2041B2|nr:complex III assembly factor LYRM7 [Onthophagus taurus]